MRTYVLEAILTLTLTLNMLYLDNQISTSPFGVYHNSQTIIMAHSKQAKEDMDCSICLTEFKRPKQLPCLHTFCLKCLRNYCDQQDDDQIPCPLCRTDFHLPSGGVESLPDDDFMARLVLRKTTQEGTSSNCQISMCEICVDIEGEIEADSFCLDCGQNVCGRCKIIHKRTNHTKLHKIVSITEKPNEDVLHRLMSSYCSEHSNKEIELYCCDCRTLICVLCHAIEHSKHVCKAPHDVAKQIKELSERDRKCLEKCRSEASDNLTKLIRAKQDFLLQVSAIKTAVGKSIARIIELLKLYETEMLTNLNNIKNNVLEELESQKMMEEFHSTALDSFFKYSQMVLDHGTDCDVIRVSDNLHQRAVELTKDDKKDVRIGYEKQLKFIESPTPSADDVRKLVGSIIYKPHTDDKESLLRSDSNIKIVPHKQEMKGLAVVDNEIFVARCKQMKVNVYDSKSLTTSRDINVPGMQTPVALAGCSYSKALYISDVELKSIHRVDLTDNSVTRWKMGQNHEPCGLSVTTEHTLLVTVQELNAIRGKSGVVEYASDGQPVREIRFHSSIGLAPHTIRLSRNQLIVCHGDVSKSHQRKISIVNNNGQITKCYDGKAGPGEHQMKILCSLAIDDKSKRVFVADSTNNKVLQLDTDLRYVGQVHMPHGLSGPYHLHYDSSSHRLLVGEFRGRLAVISLE